MYMGKDILNRVQFFRKVNQQMGPYKFQKTFCTLKDSIQVKRHPTGKGEFLASYTFDGRLEYKKN